MNIRALAGVQVLLMAATPGHAGVGEETTLTLWVRGYPVTRGGTVSACSLEYNAAGRDFIYKEGGTFGVVGNLTVNRVMRDGQPVMFASLKVTLNDIVGERQVPSAPVELHVVAADGTIMNERSGEAFNSDMPGSRVQAFLIRDGFERVMIGALEKRRLTIAFNRRAGGTDVHVPIDLTVKEVDLETGSVSHSDEMVGAFASCLKHIAPE